jgi:transcriptional regulator with XRE-family HTH domain
VGTSARPLQTALDDGTAASEIAPAPGISETRVEAYRLTEDIGWTRQQAGVISDDLVDLHKRGHDVEWRTRSAERAQSSVVTMLGDLADLGFAWRDLARLIGVSVPAIQKWRRGEKASGDSRQKAASLLAACDLIRDHYMVEDIASWFEVPLVRRVPLTPLDLYAEDRADLVFAFASGQEDPETLVSQFDPDWRAKFHSELETFVATDGNPSVRFRD